MEQQCEPCGHRGANTPPRLGPPPLPTGRRFARVKGEIKYRLLPAKWTTACSRGLAYPVCALAGLAREANRHADFHVPALNQHVSPSAPCIAQTERREAALAFAGPPREKSECCIRLFDLTSCEDRPPDAIEAITAGKVDPPRFLSDSLGDPMGRCVLFFRGKVTLPSLSSVSMSHNGQDFAIAIPSRPGPPRSQNGRTCNRAGAS
jgi:hypothetical protein